MKQVLIVNRVEYDERGDLSRLPAPTGLSLYRIAQESLSNAARHAASAPVTMRLLVDDRAARLQVSNPVPEGMARRSDGHGSGLAGMQARADQLGAALEAGPGRRPVGRRRSRAPGPARPAVADGPDRCSDPRAAGGLP